MKLEDLYENKAESQFFKTKEEIEEWLKEKRIGNYIINDDLTVDVNGSVSLIRNNIVTFPVQFGVVTGGFQLNECIRLKSLIGCPTFVGSHFNCNKCYELRSLEGMPKKIIGNLNGYGCTGLTTIEIGYPISVGGYVNFNACSELTTLKNIHKSFSSIGDTFFCKASTFRKMRSCVLGFLKIKGIRRVEFDNPEVTDIINKYIPEGDMLDCIDELTDAGFEEYAKL